MSHLSNYAALVIAILMTIGSQILLKIGASRSGGSLNVHTLSGMAMFGLVTVLIVYALQVVDLKTVIGLNALTFIGVPLAAKAFLGEELTRRGIMASLIIAIGILVFFSAG